jgi:hypothetical protein
VAIDTREELINALHEASEIEHGLLVQYLYAGLSMKKGLNEGLTTHQQRRVRDWQARLFRTAREEMGHLGIVCNLLAAIGAPAKLHRPPMPMPTGYYPFPFDLIPFGDEALHKFLVFELPRGFPLPPPPGSNLDQVLDLAPAAEIAPEPITFQFVGELYAKIADGFRAIPENGLFIGPASAQTDIEWSDPNLDIHVVSDRASALSAIENVIEDGEGTSTNRARSHYNGFLDVRTSYFRDGRFAAARSVPRNPATRPNPKGAGPVTLITNPTSLRLAELFNTAYGVMLLMLQHYFSFAPGPRDGTGSQERQALRLASQRIMSIAVRPLAEQLTTAPLGDPAAPERAGPSFEIYSDIAVSPYPAARWTILLERLAALAAECSDLGTTMPRLSGIGEILSIMREDLAAEAGVS